MSEANPTLSEIREAMNSELAHKLTDATHEGYFPTVRGDIGKVSKKLDTLTQIEMPERQAVDSIALQLTSVMNDVDSVNIKVDHLQDSLSEILRRLPAPPA